MKVFIPINYDVAKALPAGLVKHTDSVKYILHTIYLSRLFSFNRKERKELNPFVPLKYKYLIEMLPCKKVLPKILDHLISSGAVECDNHFVTGVKCKGYRIGKLFSSKFKVGDIAKRSLVKTLTRWRDKQFKGLMVNQQLLYNDLIKIEIDLPNALEYCELESNSVIKQYIQDQIRSIHNKMWWFIVDPYGRIHTNLTNLTSDLRQFLVIKNSKLSSVDISNSQPLFLSIMMNKDQYNEDNTNYKIERVVDTLHNRQLFDKIERVVDTQIERVVDTLHTRQLFDKDCEEGKLYERIAEYLGVTRNEVKQPVLRTLYLNPKLWRTKLQEAEPFQWKVIKAFQELYPKVWDYTLDARNKDYKQLSRRLQHTESQFVFNQCVSRIRSEQPDIWLATIHDSIICLPDNVKYVEFIIRDEFAKINVFPKLKVEEKI